MVPAVGIGIFRRIENTQVIDFSRRQKRRTRQNCAYLERAIFSSPANFVKFFLERKKISNRANRFEPPNSLYRTPGHFTCTVSAKQAFAGKLVYASELADLPKQ